ncbi:MAG: hypothetical protein BWK78_06025 [Thiotrichaceae bacterium IS1]|nr:MAG: hypothetical protein BWK78_06025 [Thiotrichaceae bacterium IS1]
MLPTTIDRGDNYTDYRRFDNCLKVVKSLNDSNQEHQASDVRATVLSWPTTIDRGDNCVK